MANPFLCFDDVLIHGKGILHTMLPVRTGCKIGNICFRLNVMLLSGSTLNLIIWGQKALKKDFFRALFDPKGNWLSFSWMKYATGLNMKYINSWNTLYNVLQIHSGFFNKLCKRSPTFCLESPNSACRITKERLHLHSILPNFPPLKKNKQPLHLSTKAGEGHYYVHLLNIWQVEVELWGLCFNYKEFQMWRGAHKLEAELLKCLFSKGPSRSASASHCSQCY